VYNLKVSVVLKVRIDCVVAIKAPTLHENIQNYHRSDIEKKVLKAENIRQYIGQQEQFDKKGYDESDDE
jgi:hypothetical protein